MKLFKPVIVDSSAKDPFQNNPKYTAKKSNDTDYKGKQYTKITYSRVHENLLWKVKNAFLGILGYLSVIPVILDRKGVNKLWKRAMTGEEIKVVLLRKSNSKPILPPKSVQFDPNIDPYKHKDLNEKIQKREYPPISSMADTVIFDRKTQTVRSVRGNGQLFKDEEILEKLEIQKVNSLPDTKILVKYTSYNKPIIQQQAQRGCTAAVVAMLIYEKGGVVDINALICTNLGNKTYQKELIKKANFIPISEEIDSANYLKDLKALIEKNGSAIVSIDDKEGLGCHVIVVDAVSNDLQRVRLRDPYHGWEVTVSGVSFMQREPSYVIQIQNS